MAVLGVRDRGGWRTPEDYPPILSKVIKLARFMVVRKAMELAENEDDAEPAIPWHGRPHGRCTADLDGGFAAMPPSGPDSWDQLYDNPFNEDPNGVCAGSADPMALDGTAGYGSISRIIPHYPSLIQATATAFSPSAGRHSTDGSHVFGEAAGGGPIHMANPLVPRVVEHST
uniref:PAB-dependent poly(A)-specific ribonuclease subunit PAN3 n=1 Tax=Talaromyces marneffei PM1 TaxID=1077442 RepID=A0A093V1S1_TALMA